MSPARPGAQPRIAGAYRVPGRIRRKGRRRREGEVAELGLDRLGAGVGVGRAGVVALAREGARGLVVEVRARVVAELLVALAQVVGGADARRGLLARLEALARTGEVALRHGVLPRLEERLCLNFLLRVLRHRRGRERRQRPERERNGEDRGAKRRAELSGGRSHMRSRDATPRRRAITERMRLRARKTPRPHPRPGLAAADRAAAGFSDWRRRCWWAAGSP